MKLEMKSKSISWIRKTFGFLSMLAMLLLCNGCLIFSSEAEHLCYKCYEDIKILERRAEFSQDGKSLSVYLKKRTTSRRDPFNIWQKVYEEEATQVYPLTTPQTSAVLKKILIIPDKKCRESCRFRMVDFEKKKDNEAMCRPHAKTSSDGLFLPASFESLIQRTGADDVVDAILTIHPDDLKYLSGPFVVRSHTYNNDSLVIPLKMERDCCYAYSPKEDLIGAKEIYRRPNTSQTVWKVILRPPAFVLDVVTSPLQIVYIVWGLAHFKV
jgi:hypothetical protein